MLRIICDIQITSFSKRCIEERIRKVIQKSEIECLQWGNKYSERYKENRVFMSMTDILTLSKMNIVYFIDVYNLK